MPEGADKAHGHEIRSRALAFSRQVVHLCQVLYASGGVGRLMVPQVLSASTSVAAMLEEARAAESRKDFISKLSIALKECRESHTRLRLLETSNIGPTNTVRALRQEAHELVAILTAILRNTKRNSGFRS